MKFLILLAGVCGLAQGQQCNADNCARAVTGTIRGLPAQSSAKKDCESFFKVTLSPVAVSMIRSHCLSGTDGTSRRQQPQSLYFLLQLPLSEPLARLYRRILVNFQSCW